MMAMAGEIFLARSWGLAGSLAAMFIIVWVKFLIRL